MSDIVRLPSLDALSEHYQTGLPDSALPQEDQDLLARLNFCDNLIRGCRTRKFCKEALIKKFNVSSSTAYRDYNDTKRFFGSLSLAEKEYDKQHLEEMAMKGVRMAIAAGDLKAYFTGIKEIRLLRGYGSEEANSIPIEDLIHREIIIRSAGSKGPIDINLDSAEDIDHQDVTELLGQSSIFEQPVGDLQKLFAKKDGPDHK